MNVLKKIGLVVSFLIFFICCCLIIAYRFNENASNKKMEKLRKEFRGESHNFFNSNKKFFEVENYNDIKLKGDNDINEILTNGRSIINKFKKLYSDNEDIIGWISINNTQLDYPVMQSDDNEFYLNHNFDKKFDRKGVPFLDTRCDYQKPGKNLIIYGHNQKDGSRFGSLLLYKDEDYYKSNKIIRFDTLYEEAEYEIVSVFISKIYERTEDAFKYYNYTDMNSYDEFEEFSRNIKEMSLYNTNIELSYEDEYITLSTCEYSVEDGRFVIVARKIR